MDSTVEQQDDRVQARGNGVLRSNLATMIPEIGPDAVVARKLGVDTSTVWRWRHGFCPRESSFVSLCELAGRDPGQVRYRAISGG